MVSRNSLRDARSFSFKKFSWSGISLKLLGNLVSKGSVFSYALELVDSSGYTGWEFDFFLKNEAIEGDLEGSI